MKKILYSIFAIAMATCTFTSCEDVPEPYDIPGGSAEETPPTEEPAGDGTLANPFNAIAANEYTSKLASGEESATDIYIKGKVVSIKENFTTQFGNAAFYIADTETSTNKFYIFRALYLGNKKYTSGDLLKEGDEVVVCGKVTNYRGNTPETVQNKAYIYSINGKTSSEGGQPPITGEAKGDGTLENPFNSVAANQLAMSLGDNEQSEVVYIKGKISSIKEPFSTQFGNATFNISDDGTTNNQFYVFRTLYLGNVKYTEGENIAVGDDVVVCGKLTKYVGTQGIPTPETVPNESYLYSLTKNGGSTGGGDIDDPNALIVDPNSFGLTNQTLLTTLTLTDGTTLTFSKGDGATAPAYYTGGGGTFRMYPQNSIDINAVKPVKDITVTVDVYNNITCNAEEKVTCTSGNVSFKDNIVKIESIGNNKFVIKNAHEGKGTASQFRIKSMAISYAE